MRGDGRPPDRSSYPKSLKRTKELLGEYEKYNGTKITYESITLEFYFNFLDYMQNEKGYMINTMGKYIKYIKSILKASYSEGLHDNRAFSHSKFKILSEQADTIYLDEDDLKLLESLDLKGYPGLNRTRDLFLVMSMTGVRFSDLSKIRITNIHEDNFVFRDQKENNTVVLPVFPVVKSILEKYGDSGLPTITNQVFNRNLKEIGKKLQEASKLKGINAQTSKYKKITTHTARRSFATNLYHILPVNLIMSLTGHKTESEFFKYIRITPHENADRIRHLIPSLQSDKSNAN